MARDFDGVNDYLGNPAGQITGIDNNAQTMCAWIDQASVGGVVETIIALPTSTSGTTDRNWVCRAGAASGFALELRISAATQWQFITGDIAYGQHSVVCAYNRGTVTTGSIPSAWVDGVTATVTNTQGSGSPNQTASYCKVGNNHNNGTDYGGTIGWVVVVDGELTSDDANRFHWWGATPGGPSTMLVWLPMWTNKTANTGSAATTFSNNSGTTMKAMPKVERCWASTMGCGR